MDRLPLYQKWITKENTEETKKRLATEPFFSLDCLPLSNATFLFLFFFNCGRQTNQRKPNFLPLCLLKIVAKEWPKPMSFLSLLFPNRGGGQPSLRSLPHNKNGQPNENRKLFSPPSSSAPETNLSFFLFLAFYSPRWCIGDGLAKLA